MKKIIIIVLLMMLTCTSSVFAEETVNEEEIAKEQTIQNKINSIGTRILNANKIPNRVVFVYNKAEKKSKLKYDKTLTSRNVVMYNGTYKYTDSDDEIAAFLARDIVLVSKSYDGEFSGELNSIQIMASPKKYEIIADKLAVDMMVNAGYNPLGLITFINKTCPQRRFDFVSNKNLTSKRLAIIYEYIVKKYPYFLVNNNYLNNEYYQNFLLTSQENRRMLKKHLETGSKEKIKYE